MKNSIKKLISLALVLAIAITATLTVSQTPSQAASKVQKGYYLNLTKDGYIGAAVIVHKYSGGKVKVTVTNDVDCPTATKKVKNNKVTVKGSAYTFILTFKGSKVACKIKEEKKTYTCKKVSKAKFKKYLDWMFE